MESKFRYDIISVIFILSIILFLVNTIIIGGDALSGKIENSKYYVLDAVHKSNSRGEKLYLEVSKSVYYYSLVLNYVCSFLMIIFLFSKIKEYLLQRKANIKQSNT